MAKKSIILINTPVMVVDKIQMYAYPDMQPFGLLQISSYLKEKGYDVQLIDFSYGDYRKNLFFYKDLPAGVDSKCSLPSFYMGYSFSYLKNKLKELSQPDEIWVTCSMIYNYPLAFETIRICKDHFPKSKILFGGSYPTNNPEHAKKSLCDDIFIGKFKEAERYKPDYTLYKQVHSALFRLSTGCPNKCSFCINNLDDIQSFDIDFVINYLVELEKKYKIEYFANWDPNILIFKSQILNFLKRIKGKISTPIRFDMGLQPNLISKKLIKLMYQSNIETITIPFDNDIRFRKPYSIISSIKCLYNAKQYGFKFKECHCTFVIGYPDDNIKKIFLTFSSIIKLGGRSMCFPLTIVPNTEDYRQYYYLIKQKDPVEYNGHLWPLIPGIKIKYYRNLLYFLNSPDLKTLKKRLKTLPSNIQNIFLKEYHKSDKFINFCLKHKDTNDNLDIILNSLKD